MGECKQLTAITDIYFWVIYRVIYYKIKINNVYNSIIVVIRSRSVAVSYVDLFAPKKVEMKFS